MKSNEIKRNQIKSNQIKSNQIKSNEKKLKKINWTSENFYSTLEKKLFKIKKFQFNKKNQFKIVKF